MLTKVSEIILRDITMSGNFRQFREVDWTTNWEAVWKYTVISNPPQVNFSFPVELVHKDRR